MNMSVLLGVCVCVCVCEGGGGLYHSNVSF